MPNSILTPDQYVCVCTHDYPTLYASDSFKQTKNLVFEQTFNVIGNGLRGSNGLLKTLTQTKFNPDLDYARYWNGTPLFKGYTRLDEARSNRMDKPMPDIFSCIPGAYTSEEQEKITELHGIKLWRELTQTVNTRMKQEKDNLHEVRNPYPNFEKTYSMVWDGNFHKLGPDWVDAALEYYTDMQSYFEGNCQDYSDYYPPRSENEKSNRDEDIQDYLDEKIEEPDGLTQIEKDYGVPFNPETDTVETFLTNKWQKEHQRILNFIGETITHLQTMKTQYNQENTVSP